MNTNTRNDFEKFIILMHKAAKANGIVVKEEKELIESFCDESVPYDIDDDKISMDELKDYLADLTPERKKQILSGILMVVFADGHFDSSECNFVYDLAKDMSIDEQDLGCLITAYENAPGA